MAAIAATGAGATAQDLHVWSVDPLTKVFRDDAVRPGNAGLAEVARGETATWQLVVRCDGKAADLKVQVGALRSDDGSSLKAPAIRYVGYVPVDRGMAEPAKDVLRPCPADYPDVLYVEAPKTLDQGQCQPLWLDVAIPKTAAAGLYTTTVRVSVKVGDKTTIAKLPISLKVYDVTVGKSRLWVTNWFFTTTGHMPGSNKFGTKEEEPYLEMLGKKLAAHRQNVALINALELAKFAWDKTGAMSVDFARFDAWVRILQRAGVGGRIEGGHIGGRVSEVWSSAFGVTIKVQEGDKVVSKQVAPDSPEADKFYSQYLPLLVKHLKEKRWWGKYVQHLGDEPIPANTPTYKQMADLVRKYAPGMKTIEATHTKDVAGAVDVWVPQLNFAHTDYEFYKARQKAGDEFWTYTCVWPEGEYANRFIELPLIKTRILHWINYRYGITGYLHWGFNYWVKGDVFGDVTRTKEKDGWGGFLPAGDSWLVYPKDGKLLDSIRLEAMRDGIADHELLSMLGDRNPSAAQDLAKKIVLAFDQYTTDVAKFRGVRRSLLESLERR